MVAPVARRALLASARSATAPLRLAPPRVGLGLGLSQQARMLSFSPFRRLAQPTTSPSRIQSGPPKTPNPAETANAGAAHSGSVQSAPADAPAQVGGLSYPDYSKGPSALDKAAQLFFFTEILRGAWGEAIEMRWVTGR